MSISVFKFPASIRAIPFIVAGVLGVGSCAPSPSPNTSLPSLPMSSGEQIAPGEVLVQFHPGTSSARMEEILAATGARIDKSLGTPFVFMVRPSGGRTADELIMHLREYREVLYAEPNRIRRF